MRGRGLRGAASLEIPSPEPLEPGRIAAFILDIPSHRLIHMPAEENIVFIYYDFLLKS
jgi:hypothetical protein